MKRLYVFIGVVTLLLVLGACGPVRMPPVTQEPVISPTPIEAMTPEAKRATIATSFPAEVPVALGDFTRAQAQGEDAWDYVVEVEATAAEVVRWYRDAYMGRQWLLMREGEFDGVGGGGTFLDFRKNRAESSVNIYGDDSRGFTRVKVTVGIGAPVLQTQ